MIALDTITDLDTYMEAFGPTLAAATTRALEPLHVPGRDAPAPILATLARPLYPAQAHVATALARGLMQERSMILVGEMGTGKGGLPTTRVLTPTGWTTLGNIKVGDVVADPSTGGASRVIGVYPRGIMPMFRVRFTDGSETVCSDDHLWMVNTPLRKWRGQPGRVRPLAALRERLAHANGNLQHFIPMTHELELNHEGPRPIEPYLLGLLIGNGYLNGGTPAFSTADADTLERLRAALPPGIEARPTGDSGYDWSLAGHGGVNQLTSYLRDLDMMRCRSEDKFIPESYLFAPLAARLQLIAGLCDTDGHPARGYAVEYCTASGRLAEDARFLFQSIGATVTKTERVPTFTYNGETRTGQTSHRLYASFPRWFRPFLSRRKAERYTPGDKYPPSRAITDVEPIGDGDCICIAVDSPSQLYVTDDCLVTHNTRIAAAAAHAHANGRPYRGLVMAPDHLIEKWTREIRTILPAALIHGAGRFADRRLDDWRHVVALAARRDERAVGAEWYVIGRDFAKGDPKWEPRVWRRRMLSHDPIKRDDGSSYRPVVEHLSCPRCAARILDGDGIPVAWSALARLKRSCPACGEPLWQFVSRPTKAVRERRARSPLRFRDELRRGCEGTAREDGTAPHRWAPDLAIQRLLPKGWFDYFIPDELHEEKSDDSAQGAAAGKLAACATKTIGLTGTLIGGYAWHVFPTLYRLAPAPLVARGFRWGQKTAFTERYGRIEETVITTEPPIAASSGSHSRRRTTRHIKRCKPGIMPTLFGDMLMGNTVFLGLEEVSEALPPRPADEMFAVDMDPDQRAIYEMIEHRIAEAIAPMIRRGDVRLLSRMLHALLDWPDRPWGWAESKYLAEFGIDDRDGLDLSSDRVYPKEHALLDFINSAKSNGDQTWIYCQMTGVRDVRPRLRDMIRGAGLTCDILHRQTDRRRRERWIADAGASLDVAISHPKLVETGLDLFDPRPDGSNFNVIGFYETGYNLFTLRQAGRRAWRIGQRKPCRLGYFYYRATMQERAMTLMGKKLAAALALDGKFTAEGLAALAADEGTELALARALAAGGVESAERAWTRVGELEPAGGPEAWDVPAPPAEPKAPAVRRKRRKKIDPHQGFLFEDD